MTELKRLAWNFSIPPIQPSPCTTFTQRIGVAGVENITAFCERGERSCYAENAFNQISDRVCIRPLDVKDLLCCEIDTPEDLDTVKTMLKKECEK